MRRLDDSHQLGVGVGRSLIRAPDLHTEHTLSREVRPIEFIDLAQDVRLDADVLLDEAVRFFPLLPVPRLVVIDLVFKIAMRIGIDAVGTSLEHVPKLIDAQAVHVRGRQRVARIGEAGFYVAIGVPRYRLEIVVPHVLAVSGIIVCVRAVD